MKSRDTFAPIGPYIVTADEISNPQNLQIRLRNNGDLKQTAAKIKARLLTITSKQDLSVNPSRPAEFAEIIGGAHLEVDHIMGHFAVIDGDQVAVVNEAIQSFLA